MFDIGDHLFLCIDMGKALVCAEFGSSRDAAQLDAKFQSMRSVLEQVHG